MVIIAAETSASVTPAAQHWVAFEHAVLSATPPGKPDVGTEAHVAPLSVEASTSLVCPPATRKVARQSVEVGHDTVPGSPSPLGSEAVVQVPPPSVV
jgi:hypothetical protein